VKCRKKFESKKEKSMNVKMFILAPAVIAASARVHMKEL
jgi:hypothetical protein